MHTLYAKAYSLSLTVGGSFLKFTCGKQKPFCQSEIHCLIKPSVIRFWRAAESALVDRLKIQFCFTFSCSLLKDNYLWWHWDVRTTWQMHQHPHLYTHDGWQLLTALTSFFQAASRKLITSASHPPNTQQRACKVCKHNIWVWEKNRQRQGSTRSRYEKHWALYENIILAWKVKEKEWASCGRFEDWSDKKQWNWLSHQARLKKGKKFIKNRNWSLLQTPDSLSLQQ